MKTKFNHLIQYGLFEGFQIIKKGISLLIEINSVLAMLHQTTRPVQLQLTILSVILRRVE